jgi:hypothetical protein
VKLVGSRTEDTIRDEIIGSAEWLRSHDGIDILRAIEFRAGKVYSAFVLVHTLDQDSESFVVLINGKMIVEIERINENSEMKVEMLKFQELQDYRRKLKGKLSHLRLEIALRLSMLGED